MTKIVMKKTMGGKLEAVGDAGREVLDRIPYGDICTVEIKRPRNGGHHRKLFALLDLIYKNQSRYRSVEELLDAIKVYTGHCSIMVLRDGTEVRVPKSISFSSMDQSAFEKFWDSVVSVVCQEIIPGLNRSDLERELLEICA